MAKDHAEAQAKSILLNLNREFHLKCLTNGIGVPGLITDDEGFYRVSYHVAGVRSAWVQQAKIRSAWPALDTKVVDVSDKPCEWSAEIWAKRKEDQ